MIDSLGFFLPFQVTLPLDFEYQVGNPTEALFMEVSESTGVALIQVTALARRWTLQCITSPWGVSAKCDVTYTLSQVLGQ